MKSVTKPFKQQMHKPVETKVILKQGDKVFDDAEELNPSFDGSLLKTLMKQLNLTKENNLEKGSIVNAYIGIKVNEAYEYVFCGNFVVYSSEKQEDTNSYEIICYDKMLYSMVPYKKMEDIFPCSVRTFIKKLSESIGLTFKNENDEFVNFDKIIESELYDETYTVRDIFDELSQVVAGSIKISSDDQIEIGYVNDLVNLNTANGTTINVTDALEYPTKIELEGKSVQSAEPSLSNPVDIINIRGINMFNKDDIEQGYRLDSSGNLYHENGYNTSKFIKIEPNTDYCRNVNIIQLEPVCTYDKNKTFIRRIQTGNTFTTSESEVFIKTTTSDEHIDTMQIEKGTIPHDYIPYNNIQFKDVGENLYNYTKTTNVSTGCTSDENGWITITCDNTTNNTSAYKNYYTYDLPLKNNTPYNVIVEIDEKTGNFANFNVVSTISNDTQFTENFVLYNAITSGNIYQKLVNTGNDMSSTNGKLGLRTYIAFSPNQAGTVKFRISVLEDTTITTNDFVYKPYEEKTVNVDLQGNELCSTKDKSICDKLVIENGKAKIIKNIRHLSLKIADMNNANDYPGWKDQTQLKADYPNLNGGMYNYGIAHMTNIGIQGTSGNYFVAINTNTDGVIWLSKGGFGNDFTQEYWKENYPDLTVELYYALSTPEIIDLGNIGQFKTFDGINKITNSENVSMNISYANDWETIDEDFLMDKNVSFGEKYGPINSVVLSRSADSDGIDERDEESIAENGLCEFKISENQIMNFNDRSDYLPGIFEKLSGLEFYAADFDTYGILYLDFLDVFRVKVKDKYYKCIMLCNSVKLKDGLEENVYSEKPEESITDYSKTDKTDRRINKAYFMVKKQEQELEGLVSRQNDTNEQLAQVIMTTSSIQNTVKDTMSNINNVTNSVEQLTNQMKTNQTSTNLQISAIQSTIENGVENVKNNTVDINNSGATFGQDGSPFKANINFQNLNIKQNDEEISFFGYDPNLKKTVARIPSLETEKMSAGVHRQEKFTRDSEERTGLFFIGGN